MLARDMVPGILYHTVSQNRFMCRVLKKADAVAELIELIYFDHLYCKQWFDLEVDGDYKVEKLLDENGNEKIYNSKSSEFQTTQRSTSKRIGGQLSGMSMMEAWGFYFNKFIREIGGRAKIIEAMIAEFPDKIDSINKWVDSYKSYYNLGRLPGCKVQPEKLNWIFTDPLEGLE